MNALAAAEQGRDRWLRLAPYLVAAAIPLAVFVFSPWRGVLNPARTGWLDRGDSAQHQLGWLFFAREPAGFSPRIDDWPHPIGTTIGLTDSIPLVAFPMRALTDLAGERDVAFQYFGPWLALCLAALGACGTLVLRQLGAGRLLAALGGGLVAVNPVVWERMARGHYSLCALALFVAAFALWLRAERTGERADYFRFGALPVAAAAIHPYLALMVAALWAAALGFELRRQGRRLLRWGAPALAVAAVAAAAVARWAGFLDPRATLDVGGFGGYKADLAALLLPAGRSALFPGLLVGSAHGEGFAFLGAGALLLAAVGIAGIWVDRRAGERRAAGEPGARFGRVLLVTGGLALAATLPVLTLFDREFLDLGQPIARRLGWLFSAVRVNGRLVWPFHLAVLLAIVAALRRFEGRPRLLAAILGGAILLQAADLPRDRVGPASEVVDAATLTELSTFGAGARHLALAPAVVADGGSMICGERHNLDDWERPAHAAALAGWTFNSGVFARTDHAAALAECERLAGELARHELRPETVYLVRRPLARRLERAPGVVCVPSPLERWLCRAGGQGEVPLQ